jgi:hypothetical protein
MELMDSVVVLNESNDKLETEHYSGSGKRPDLYQTGSKDHK